MLKTTVLKKTASKPHSFRQSYFFNQKGFIANNDKPFLFVIFMSIFHHLNQFLIRHIITRPGLAVCPLDKSAAGRQARYSMPYHN